MATELIRRESCSSVMGTRHLQLFLQVMYSVIDSNWSHWCRRYFHLDSETAILPARFLVTGESWHRRLFSVWLPRPSTAHRAVPFQHWCNWSYVAVHGANISVAIGMDLISSASGLLRFWKHWTEGGL